MRTLATAATTALASARVALVLLVQMDFSPVVRLASSAVAIQYDGQLYYGAGSLGTVDPVQDSTEGADLRLTLSGVPSDNLALALAEDSRGVACTIRVAVIDADTHAVLDVPIAWRGAVEQMPISLTGQTCSISVVVSHPRARLRRARPLRYTDGDQQLVSAGDTSLRFVVSQAQRKDVWPAAAFFKQ